MNSFNENNNNNKRNQDIAIIGVGFRLTSGEELSNNDSPDKFWKNLKRGFNGVIPTTERWSDNFSKLGEISNGYAGLLPFEELKAFDPLFFGISPSEVATIDPQQRLLLKTTFECLEDAGIDHQSIRGTTTSVFIGSSTTEYRESIVNVNEQYLNIFGTYAHGIANRISYVYDLRGESLTIDTACSSSGVAISLGAQSIKNGKCKLSIVGGVNLIMDTTNIKAFSYLNMLSTSGVCRPFDIGADGLIRGEGVGTILLKSLDDAIADGNKIYCVIKGTSYNVDGNGLDDKQNFYAPSSTSQSENVKMAINSIEGDEKITTDDIDYFECHGTGTPTGDPIETRGISMTFGRTKENPLFIGSLKGSSGHSEAASGVIGVIKCCLMFKNQSLVPCVNFKTPNPLIKLDEWNLKVVTEPIPFSKLPNRLKNKPILIAINNFGVTGGNCCIVLSEYIPSQEQQQQQQQTTTNSTITSKYLIPFSANSVKSLELYKQKLLSSINNGTIDLNDGKLFNSFVKNQIFNKTKTFVQRSVVIASNWDDLLNSGSNNVFKTSNSKSSNLSIVKKKPITIFVFSGQGSQYHTMINQLYNDEKVFRDSIDTLDKSLFKYYGYSVYEKLKTSNLETIQEPTIAQPAVCMLTISLFNLYKHWGIEPSFIVGHSLGEIASAYCSGMVDLETLSYVIYHRSIAQNKTHGNGRMLSINISADEYQLEYSSKYPTLEIACYNSPNSIVVGGNELLLNQLSNELKEKNQFSAMLASQSSFHTSSQSIIKNDILNLQFPSMSPKYPIFSSVTTNLFDHSTTKFNASYVYDNIISPVKFSQTISNIYSNIESNLPDANEIVFIELAPHPTLSFYLKQMKSTSDTNEYKYSIYSALHKAKNATSEFQKVISQLYCDNGLDINFNCQIESQVNNYDNEFPLPNYQWDDQSYWKVDINHYRNYVNGPPMDILGNQNYSSPLGKSFETYIDIKRKPFQYLKGHQIKKKYYFPGTGYIDNLLKMYPSQDLLIENIEFIAPLIFVEGVNQCVQTNVYQLNSNNQYKLEYHYKDSKTYEWVKTCFGEFQTLSNHFTNQSSLDIQQLIKSKCNLSTITCDDYYNMIKIRTGLEYTGSFKGVNKCYMGRNCSLVEVSTTLPTDLPDQKSFFNASILDSCTHGLLGLVEYQSQLVFQKINDFKYYKSNIPDDRSKHSHVYVYTTLNDVSNDSFSASIIIMLSNGKVLIEMDNVVSKSLVPIQDPLKIEYPTNELFSTYLQPKDSPIPSSLYFGSKIPSLTSDSPMVIENNSMLLRCCQSFISNQFLENIEKRTHITMDEINTMTTNQLVNKYCLDIKNERLFKFVFSIIKEHHKNELTIDDIVVLKKDGIHEILDKSTKIISKLLFPLDEKQGVDDPIIETPSSLFENDLLDHFYNTNNFMTTKIQSNLISDIIIDSIKPILNEKVVLRILELGGGVCSLSVVVLDKINQLLNENPLYEIDIEFTWSDISTNFIAGAKKKLEHYKNVNIIYRAIDAEKEFIKSQSLKPSYFDFIIMSNVLHVVKNIGNTLDQLYKILSPNGQILIIEPYVSLVNDSIFGSFSQWWAFEDTNLRTERCCMNPNLWLQVFSKHNFKNTNSYENDGSCCYVIHSEKPSLLNDVQSDNSKISNHQIIIYSNENETENSNAFNNHFNNDIIKISNINQFNELIYQSKVNDNTIIYFTKSIEQLSIDNFKTVSFEYIQINQILLSNNLKSKHVLITTNSRYSNYLAASVVGAKRYFEEHKQLNLNAIDFDTTSIGSINNLQSLLFELIDGVKFTQNDFIIKNGKVYYENVKKESKLKLKFQSNSFENNDSLYLKLIDSDYQLNSKQSKLNENEVEIKVIATTLKQEKNNIGEFSGIVSRLGNDLNKSFNIGDQVYGFGNNTTSSHIVVKSYWIHKKPSNLTNVQAASIPFKYLESIYGLFNVCDLQTKDSILLHSCNLTILNLLKSKGHTGPVFVTVDSKEKEMYIRKNYGNLIWEVYQNGSDNFVEKIKLMCSNGIDLIINSSNNQLDNMNSNFKCIKKNTGKILDFSNQNQMNEYYKNCRKLNISYHHVDLLSSVSKSTLLNLFNQFTNLIEEKEISLLPLVEFSNSNINNAIQMIQNDGIETIVIDNDQEIFDEQFENHSNDTNYSILKSNYYISEKHLGKNIIVTGQSGIVLEVLKWICKFSRNVENIIILSKSSIKWELELLIGKTKESIENNQIKFHFNSVDISNAKELSSTLDKVLNENNIQNIDSVFHYAFTQVTGGPQDIDMNHLEVSHAAKTIGAINLHNESIKRNWNLLNFVNASSTVTLAGSPNQCTYVCANSVLDSFSRYRKSMGLPSICSYYGSIKSGLVLRSEAIAVALEGQGYTHVSMNKVLGSLDLQIQNPNLSTNLIVSGFNFNLFKNNPQHSIADKFEHQINEAVSKSASLSSGGSNGTNGDSKLGVAEILISKVSELLSIDADKFNSDIGLVDYGADSLITGQLKNWIEKKFGPNIITISHLQNNSINSLILLIKKNLKNTENKRSE